MDIFVLSLILRLARESTKGKTLLHWYQLNNSPMRAGNQVAVSNCGSIQSAKAGIKKETFVTFWTKMYQPVGSVVAGCPTPALIAISTYSYSKMRLQGLALYEVKWIMPTSTYFKIMWYFEFDIFLKSSTHMGVYKPIVTRTSGFCRLHLSSKITCPNYISQHYQWSDL